MLKSNECNRIHKEESGQLGLLYDILTLVLTQVLQNSNPERWVNMYTSIYVTTLTRTPRLKMNHGYTAAMNQRACVPNLISNLPLSYGRGASKIFPSNFVLIVKHEAD